MQINKQAKLMQAHRHCSPYLSPSVVFYRFNQLLQTSHEDTCISSNEVKKVFLLNSALLLWLQRSLFYRLFRM